ncbi:hypothetical protein C0J52_00014 [Blattella germanica]|nr:hypothetical protein C0J52_00014 [Blattella germanica]
MDDKWLAPHPSQVALKKPTAAVVATKQYKKTCNRLQIDKNECAYEEASAKLSHTTPAAEQNGPLVCSRLKSGLV